MNKQSKEKVFNANEYLFNKFARLYSEKYGRIPKMTDKYDKANFEMFMMGWEARNRATIVAHDSETV